MIEKFRFLVGVLLFVDFVGNVIKLRPVELGPFVEVDKVGLSAVAAALDCVDFVRVLVHGLEAGELFEGGGFIDEVDGEGGPFDV